MCNAAINVMLITTAQANTPKEVRGKVMALMGMIGQGLTPLAMALGGVLGAVLPVRLVISASFLAAMLCVLPFALARSFAAYLRAGAPAAGETG